MKKPKFYEAAPPSKFLRACGPRKRFANNVEVRRLLPIFKCTCAVEAQA